MPFYIQRHSIRLSAKFPSFWIPCRRISLASIRHGLSRSSFTMYFTIINFELLRFYFSFFSHLFSNESVKLAFGLTEIFSKWDVVHFFMPGQSTNFLSLLLHNFREIFLNSFSINYLTPGSPNLRLLQQGIGQWRRRTGGKKTITKIFTWGAGIVKWWERSPLTNVAWARFRPENCPRVFHRVLYPPLKPNISIFQFDQDRRPARKPAKAGLGLLSKQCNILYLFLLRTPKFLKVHFIYKQLSKMSGKHIKSLSHKAVYFGSYFALTSDSGSHRRTH